MADQLEEQAAVEPQAELSPWSDAETSAGLSEGDAISPVADEIDRAGYRHPAQHDIDRSRMAAVRRQAAERDRAAIEEKEAEGRGREERRRRAAALQRERRKEAEQRLRAQAKREAEADAALRATEERRLALATEEAAKKVRWAEHAHAQREEQRVAAEAEEAAARERAVAFAAGARSAAKLER